MSASFRHLNDAYRDVRGAKVTTKRLRFALHRPFSPLYTDAIIEFYIQYTTSGHGFQPHKNALPKVKFSKQTAYNS